MESFAAQGATSPSQHLFQGFANPSQFPTELLFSTIYVLSLPIIPGLPVDDLGKSRICCVRTKQRMQQK